MLCPVKIQKIFHDGDLAFITYIDDSDNYEKYAAVSNNLQPHVGDIVEVFRDDYLSYRGFGGVVIRIL